MLAKVQKKGLNVILIAAMVGMGTGPNIPTAYAESTTVTQETETTNTLSKLEIEGVKLDKDLTENIKEYSASVENDVKVVSLLLKSNNSTAVITVNGQTVTNDTTGPFTLNTGENIFLITVKDESQADTTYTLTITRNQDDDNLLQSIHLSSGELSPKFSAAITEYSAQVSNEISSISVFPTANVKTATVEVNGSKVIDKGVSVKIPVGKSDITIDLTAENGMKKTYTLRITRESAATNVPVVNPTTTTNRKNSFSQTSQLSQQPSNTTIVKVSKATLSALSVSEGTWDSAFTTNEFTYHIEVSNDVKAITINPTVSYSGADVLKEGSSSKTIQLEDDHKTIISIVVSNGDDDQKTYVLVFDQEK